MTFPLAIQEGIKIAWFHKKIVWISAAVLVAAVLFISIGWQDEATMSDWQEIADFQVDHSQRDRSKTGTEAHEVEPTKRGNSKKTVDHRKHSEIVPILINQADRIAWQTVPGIGPKRAETILALRQQKGGVFRAIEDLLEVKGIGPKTLEKMRPWLKLD